MKHLSDDKWVYFGQRIECLTLKTLIFALDPVCIQTYQQRPEIDMVGECEREEYDELFRVVQHIPSMLRE